MYQHLKIYREPGDEVIQFAAEELRRCLRMMMPEEGNILIAGGSESDGIRLGLLRDLGLPGDGDPAMDDVLHIDIKKLRGVIAGSNPRSVLAAVYRYLYENGCRWPRPGVEGEIIPARTPKDIAYRHKASYRHRGLCIEGAVSYQNMLENIDWAPKVGYNAYMMEFKTPYIFFDNWYSHRCNDAVDPEPVSLEDARQRCMWIETEIKKRGMEYHAVGHAWTCEPLGISGTGWLQEKVDIPDEVRQYLAELNGVRDLYRNVALNTNLCYSNLQARKIMVDYIADYAEKYNNIDYLHIWLADGTNNHCECENCAKHDVADLYVMLLNEIDAEFVRRNIPTRLVFLIYVDLLWPPVKEKLNNPDRFSLLFAPITRTYSAPYTTEPFQGTLPPFKRNHLTFPKGLSENIAYLREWQKMFRGDSFCYEYYFWLDHMNDPGYYDIAKIILEDVKRLKDLGLDGIVSDQTQRCFLPSGFPMYVMGQALYNRDLSFEELRDEFFVSFGPDGDKAAAYMEKLSALFKPVYLRGNEGGFSWRESVENSVLFTSPEAAARLRAVRPEIDAFRAVIQANKKHPVRTIAKSWQYLEFHAELCERLADVFILRAEGDMKAARELWKRVRLFASEQEAGVQDAFDVNAFVRETEKHL